MSLSVSFSDIRPQAPDAIYAAAFAYASPLWHKYNSFLQHNREARHLLTWVFIIHKDWKGKGTLQNGASWLWHHLPLDMLVGAGVRRWAWWWRSPELPLSPLYRVVPANSLFIASICVWLFACTYIYEYKYTRARAHRAWLPYKNARSCRLKYTYADIYMEMSYVCVYVQYVCACTRAR